MRNWEHYKTYIETRTEDFPTRIGREGFLKCATTASVRSTQVTGFVSQYRPTCLLLCRCLLQRRSGPRRNPRLLVHVVHSERICIEIFLRARGSPEHGNGVRRQRAALGVRREMYRHARCACMCVCEVGCSLLCRTLGSLSAPRARASTYLPGLDDFSFRVGPVVAGRGLRVVGCLRRTSRGVLDGGDAAVRRAALPWFCS